MSKRRRKNPDRDGSADAKRAPDPAPTVETGAPSRRAFLWKTWLGVAVLATAEMVWVLIDFVWPRKANGAASGTIITAGPVDQFPVDSVTAFPQGRFYLVRLEDGGFLAVSRECTHLGCTVPWVDEEHRFVCPCHSSAFDIRGDVVNPPAPRALDVYEVRIENRVVKVNTANVAKRAVFDATQVTRT